MRNTRQTSKFSVETFSALLALLSPLTLVFLAGFQGLITPGQMTVLAVAIALMAVCLWLATEKAGRAASTVPEAPPIQITIINNFGAPSSCDTDAPESAPATRYRLTSTSRASGGHRARRHPGGLD